MFCALRNAGLPIASAMNTARNGATIATERHGMRCTKFGPGAMPAVTGCELGVVAHVLSCSRS